MVNSLIMFLYVTGIFTLALGVVHFFLPLLLDFEHAIPREGEPLKPFSLLGLTYGTLRSDIRGIAWVMNHAASYVLVTIGILDLWNDYWLHERYGPLISLWIAGWWFLRAASQLYLGRRKGDWLILIGFSAIGILHVAVVLL